MLRKYQYSILVITGAVLMILPLITKHQTSMAVIDLLVFVLLLFVLRGWAIVAWKLWQGQPILPWQPRRPVPWGFLELVVFFFLFAAITIGLSAFAQNVMQLSPKPVTDAQTTVDPAAIMIMTASYLIWLPLVISILVFMRGAKASDLGFDRSKIAQDLALGTKTFFMLAPIVFGIQAILVLLGWQSHHPLIEGMRSNPRPVMLIAGGFAAVIMAPLCEEFAFRLLFQGWLENVVGIVAAARRSRNVPDGTTSTAPITLETIWNWSFLGPPAGEQLFAEQEPYELVHSVTTPDGILDDPYRPPLAPSQDNELPITVLKKDKFELRAPWSFVPIFISSTLFALLHFGHGPDWVPLLFLAAGLGYVYQRTHRILPCMTVHFLLNATSYCMFVFWIFAPVKPQN